MINVVIGIIANEDRILLIKRERGDFRGLYGLPGGKVEECEHIDMTMEREIQEELMESDLIIESDKVMINNFYYKEGKNYLKLDCDKDENGKYFWK